LRRFLCELRDDGPSGVEPQFLQNKELLYSRRFGARTLVVRWGE